MQNMQKTPFGTKFAYLQTNLRRFRSPKDIEMPDRIFARKVNGRIVFEQCSCGGLMTQHTHSPRGQHHGRLLQRDCKEYRFERYATENEAAEIVMMDE